jgi:putative tricarboxylic transport membrane protein
VQRLDRVLGLALAVLGGVVGWSARYFPNVPGQKVGAALLPMIVAAGLVACGLALAWRSRRAAAEGATAAGQAPIGAALVVIGVIVFYVLAADRLGFLVVAPIGLVAAFRAMGVGWKAALLWAVLGTLVVHVSFYKLLRVPLPWGVFRPFY